MVIKNGEWNNIILIFLQWSEPLSKGKVEHQKIKKGTHLACYMSQQKKKFSELKAHGHTHKTCLLYSNFISDNFILYALHSIILCVLVTPFNFQMAQITQ